MENSPAIHIDTYIYDSSMHPPVPDFPIHVQMYTFTDTLATICVLH